jgi:hypothetical protein
MSAGSAMVRRGGAHVQTGGFLGSVLRLAFRAPPRPALRRPRSRVCLREQRRVLCVLILILCGGALLLRCLAALARLRPRAFGRICMRRTGLLRRRSGGGRGFGQLCGGGRHLRALDVEGRGGESALRSGTLAAREVPVARRAAAGFTCRLSNGFL